MVTPDDLADLLQGLDSPIAFAERPDPIPGDLRLGWRLASFALILARCHANTANMEQIHLLAWALRSKDSRDTLVRWFEKRKSPDDFIVRYDPSLSRTIAIAIAVGLARRNANQTISLSEGGIALASNVWSEAGVMRTEKEFLEKLPRKISQKAVREIMAW